MKHILSAKCIIEFPLLYVLCVCVCVGVCVFVYEMMFTQGRCNSTSDQSHLHFVAGLITAIIYTLAVAYMYKHTHCVLGIRQI